MPSKVKARLTEFEGEYYLELPNVEPRKMELDEVKEFILSFQDPAYFIPGSSRIVARAKGSILAKVLDTGSLLISSPELLLNLFSNTSKYISVSEYAALHNKGQRIVTRFCNEGRIPGAIQRNYRWLIPADAPYPDRISNKDN